MGYPYFWKHPYNYIIPYELLSIANEAQQAFLESRSAAFVANASGKILGKMCGSLFSWPWFVGSAKHLTGIQRFGQLLCQVRRFGTSWYNSKDNVGENSNLFWQPLSLEQVAYAIGLSTPFYRPCIDYAHFSSSRTVWHVNQNICVIKLVWSYRSVSHPHKQQMDSILQLDLWWFFSGLVQRRPKPRKLCRRTALASLANSIVIAVAPSTRMQFSANVRHKRHTSVMHICFSLNQRVYQDFSNSTSLWWFCPYPLPLETQTLKDGVFKLREDPSSVMPEQLARARYSALALKKYNFLIAPWNDWGRDTDCWASYCWVLVVIFTTWVEIHIHWTGGVLDKWTMWFLMIFMRADSIFFQA